LANKDGPGGVSDPLCVVYGLSKKKPELAELGRTEYQLNNENPIFEKTILLKYEPDDGQELVFRIYDKDVIKQGKVKTPISHTLEPLC
jgi:hypothetical protein